MYASQAANEAGRRSANSPWPGRSGAIARYRAASASSTGRQLRPVRVKPWSRTSSAAIANRNHDSARHRAQPMPSMTAARAHEIVAAVGAHAVMTAAGAHAVMTAAGAHAVMTAAGAHEIVTAAARAGS